MAFATVGFLCVSLLGGCSRSSGGAGPVPFVGLTHRVLVVGAGSGPAMDALRSRYSVDAGTGSENPGNYDMIVVDAAVNDLHALQSNPGLANFAAAGKVIVILNSTDAQRDTILKGTVFAHARGDIPATAFIPMTRGGVKGWTEVDFPVHLQQESTAGCTVSTTDPCPVALASPDPNVLISDAQQWVDVVQSRGAAVAGGVGPNPSGGPGQAAYVLDDVQPLTFAVASAVNDLEPGRGGFFGDENGYWCSAQVVEGPSSYCGSFDYPSAYQPNIHSTVNATFESTVSVLLEPNGSQYQHKVILRQYALVSPTPLNSDPAAGWRYAYYEGLLASDGLETYQTLATTLGFNASTWLRARPNGAWQGSYPMALTEALPENANNTTTLLTSQSHTEGVSVSVTGSTEKSGEVGASWNDSWTWAQTQEVSIQDWTIEQSGAPNLQYVYSATSGTKDTYDQLINYQRQFKPTGTYDLRNGASNLNDLQSGNMTSQSESVWISSGGPVGPVEETLQSSAEFVQGEVYTFQHCSDCDPSYYSNTPSYTYPENITIDFATPGLQPPTQAPWALSFSEWPATVAQQTQITGTVTIPDAGANPGPIQISYVVEPVSTLLTTPSDEACPGNQYAFVPGNNVLNNGSPPLTVTIPAGKVSVDFPLTVQTYNSQPYNVQVVAWQARGTINGTSVPNLESAWCLTVPNTTI